MNLKVSSCLYNYARFELVWILLLSSCMPVTITSSPTGYSEEKLSTPGALSAQEKKVETPAASTQLPMVTRIAQALTSSATPELQEDLYTLSVIPDSLRWDPAGSLLVYSTNDGRIWFRTKKEGSARPIVGIQVAPPARLSTAWSPDGDKLIIYGVWGENYPQWTGMWLASISNKEGSQAKQIIPPTMPEPPVYQNEGVIYTASWAPDGKRIAYSFKGEAWIYDLESGLHVQITHVTTDPIIREGQFEPFDGAREVYFSPDGNFLALGLTCNCPSPFSGVAVVNLDSREPKLMSAGRLTGWTIDSTLIIFEMSSGDWDKEYTFDVYGANPGNGKITNLTVSNPGFDMLLDPWEKHITPSFHTRDLQWLADGKYVYTTLDYRFTDEPALGFIVRSSPDSIHLEKLATKDTWYLFPNLLPDGNIGYIEAEPQHPKSDMWTGDIFEIRRGVIGQNNIETGGLKIRNAAWSPDGSSIALVVVKEPGMHENVIQMLTID